MDDYIVRFPAARPRRASLLAVMLCAAPYLLRAQAPAAPPTPPPAVPDWALPGSATHKQVPPPADLDRKSTRLNSSHLGISYAVFCLKKKQKNQLTHCRW